MIPVRAAGLMAVGALALGLTTAAPAQAQQPTPGFSGSTRSSVAGCPYIVWRLVRDANGGIHGIAYYSDLSGLSTVKGTRDADGNFQLDVTPTSMGAGPSGHVTGHRAADGTLDAVMKGSGCANATVHIPALADLNAYPTGQ